MCQEFMRWTRTTSSCAARSSRPSPTGAPLPEADYRSLAEQHVVALDDDGRVWMAHPFAAHTDGARVDAGGRTWWGNCAWDAFGIVAALDLAGRDDHRPGHHAWPADDDDAVFARARPRRALVGRHRLHLSDDAAPPVRE